MVYMTGKIGAVCRDTVKRDGEAREGYSEVLNVCPKNMMRAGRGHTEDAR